MWYDQSSPLSLQHQQLMQLSRSSVSLPVKWGPWYLTLSNSPWNLLVQDLAWGRDSMNISLLLSTVAISTLSRLIIKGMLFWRPFLERTAELPVFTGFFLKQASLLSIISFSSFFLSKRGCLRNYSKPLMIQEWNPPLWMVMYLLLITFTRVISCNDVSGWI